MGDIIEYESAAIGEARSHSHGRGQSRTSSNKQQIQGNYARRDPVKASLATKPKGTKTHNDLGDLQPGGGGAERWRQFPTGLLGAKWPAVSLPTGHTSMKQSSCGGTCTPLQLPQTAVRAAGLRSKSVTCDKRVEWYDGK